MERLQNNTVFKVINKVQCERMGLTKHLNDNLNLFELSIDLVDEVNCYLFRF